MPIHYNRTNCPKKAQYGIEYQVKEATQSDVGSTLTDIAEGRISKFIDVASILDLSSIEKSLVTSLAVLQLRQNDWW